MDITPELIIKKVERNFIKILDLYQNVPVAILMTPTLPNGWSVKDTLAQIAAWEWRCAALLNAAHETDGPLRARPDVRGLNREIYQERRDWGWTRVERDLCHAHQALLEAIQQLPLERLSDTLVQRAITEETQNRYAEHLSKLEHWRQQVIDERVQMT